MSIRVSGVKVDNADINAKFAAYEAAGKSIKACFRKNTAMGSATAALEQHERKLVKDFKYCSGRPVRYIPGTGDSQPTCRVSKSGLRIPSYAKRNPAGNCTKDAFAKTLSMARGGRRRTKKRHYKHPKKGRKSRTHKGRKDFTTKKSSKVFHRRKHYQRKSAKGVKRRPYHKRR
jgi:hypothetical protein